MCFTRGFKPKKRSACTLHSILSGHTESELRWSSETVVGPRTSLKKTSKLYQNRTVDHVLAKYRVFLDAGRCYVRSYACTPSKKHKYER